MTTTVTFKDSRIGRHRDVAPLVTEATEPLPILDAVERYARRFLGSRDVDSDFFPHMNYGEVYAGVRIVARFTVDPLPDGER